jgi:hypothetical protein
MCTDSVISTTNCFGGQPSSSSRSPNCRTKPGERSCSGEKLTPVTSRASAGADVPAGDQRPAHELPAELDDQAGVLGDRDELGG